MKKVFLSIVIFSAFSILAAQAASLPAKKKFVPISWNSNSTNDVITLQNGGSSGRLLISVQSELSAPMGNVKLAGINIRGCGSVNHVNPGSATLCRLSSSDQMITFSSDGSGKFATGTYQID